MEYVIHGTIEIQTEPCGSNNLRCDDCRMSPTQMTIKTGDTHLI